ncbi:hypothetical protein HDV00_006232 [Rhizophlyctis rosea]|nr:hypothetical protein HDV00_006232 [Rhizophlyctis rosea]
MVSFVCDYCQETLKKPKLEQHTWKCYNAQFTCIDCNTTFNGDAYKAHTSCISEAEKYQKSLYKGKKNQNQNQNQKNAPKAEQPTPKSSQTNIAKAPEADSLISQIKKAEAQSESSTTPSKKRKADADDGEVNGNGVTVSGDGEKEKKTKKEKKDKKEKKEKKDKESADEEEKPAKKAKKEQWDDEDLDEDFGKTVPLAVVSVLSTGKEMSLRQLKKKVIKKFSKHPKNTLSKDELTEKVEDHLTLTATDAGVLLKQ